MSHVEATTLFDLLLGRQPQSSGQLSGIATNRIQALYADDGLYPTLTVQQYLRPFAQFGGHSADLASLYQSLALRDVASTPIRGDQRQRLVLLRGLLAQPDLLLIESPLTNLTNAGDELFFHDNSLLVFPGHRGLTKFGVAGMLSLQ